MWRRRPPPTRFCAVAAIGAYLTAVETVENVVFSLVPRPVITGMTATAIPVAIRPYSMAVAALSSFQNLTMRRIRDAPCRSIYPYKVKSYRGLKAAYDA